MGTLSEYEIPVQALPRVVEVQKLRRDAPKPLTIREAKWIGRLCCLAGDVYKLGLMALYYAHREMVCELAGIKCDTFLVDGLIIEFPEACAGIILAERYRTDDQMKGIVESALETEKLLGISLAPAKFTSLLAWIFYNCRLLDYMKPFVGKARPPEKEIRKVVEGMREDAIKFALLISGVSLDTKIVEVEK